VLGAFMVVGQWLVVAEVSLVLVRVGCVVSGGGGGFGCCQL
jgi:hypothetical protein